MEKHFALAAFLSLFALQEGSGQNIGDIQYPYEWVSLDYDWKDGTHRNESIMNGTFIVENNVITGIKVHKDAVYVTVSRWLKGVPSTMNKVVMKDGKAILQPYPSWAMQELDDCDAFQFTQSMEIDPAKNEMWVIDVGRRNIWTPEDTVASCPPKLVIINLNNGQVVHRYTFPNSTLSHEQNFVNDITIDPDRQVAYMSDTGVGASGHKGGIAIYDRRAETSHRHEHWSMLTEPENINITINGNIFPNDVPVDGIGLTPDKEQLYYCALGALGLWHMPASSARDPNANLNETTRYVGEKSSQTDGILFGHKNFYFGALSLNAVYKWEHSKDTADQNTTLEFANMTTQTQLAKDNMRLRWADTFALDDQGWLWTTANQLPLFKERMVDFESTLSNFYIAKIYVDDRSYLQPEVEPTQEPIGFAVIKVHSLFVILASLLVSITFASYAHES